MPARPDAEMIDHAVEHGRRNWERGDLAWPRTFRFKAELTLEGGVHMLSAMSPDLDAEEVIATKGELWADVAARFREAATKAISKAREDRMSAQAHQPKASRTNSSRDDDY